METRGITNVEAVWKVLYTLHVEKEDRVKCGTINWKQRAKQQKKHLVAFVAKMSITKTNTRKNLN